MVTAMMYIRFRDLVRIGAMLVLFCASVVLPVVESMAAGSDKSTTEAVGTRSPVLVHPGMDQASAVAEPLGEPEHRSLTTFFAIGIAINLLMLVVLSVWAYRQLRRQRKPRQP